MNRAIEEAQRREEEEKLRREEEARQRVEKEQQEKKAREEAERFRKENEERLRREEEERQERRKRVEAIMSRTRNKGGDKADKGNNSNNDNIGSNDNIGNGQAKTNELNSELENDKPSSPEIGLYLRLLYLIYCSASIWSKVEFIDEAKLKSIWLVFLLSFFYPSSIIEPFELSKLEIELTENGYRVICEM